MTEPRSIIDTEAPNVAVVENRQTLVEELAATVGARHEAEDERRETVRTLNEKIKKLVKRERELVHTIKQGGIQLQMHFGTVASDTAVVTPKKRGRKGKAEQEPVQ